MKKLLPAISMVALIGVILPPVLYLAGVLDKGSMSQLMLAGTLFWFVTVPFWMDKQKG